MKKNRKIQRRGGVKMVPGWIILELSYEPMEDNPRLTDVARKMLIFKRIWE
jgi:hypothetical protein